MHLKKIVLDGFKSYGKRTEVNDFDREFTAITGLNGTGKSNILDSICFVLGLSNISQVRAGSLKDLIYKGGQTNIKHASVTLIFDNTNQNQCPIGYERCAEIAITRKIEDTKTKYFINGRNVQAKKVSDFFCGIQLNVNNPNFLIMQGRITKVLNMKPQEVLSMIEEAAGTSLYESKREATTKLIEKKEYKVRETNTLLTEEVEPKLDKLRSERDAFVEYQRICRDIEYLTRIHISFRYLKLNDSVKSTKDTIEKLNARIELCKKTIVDNNEECERNDVASKEIQTKIDSECGGELKKIEEELHIISQNEAKANGSIKATQANIEQQEKKLKSIEKNIADDEKALTQKEFQMSKVDDLFQNLKDADTNDALAYEEAQKNFEAVMQGLSTNEDGVATSLQDQLIAAKKQASDAQTLIKTSDMELRHCRNVVKQKENETQSNDAAYIKDKHACEQLEAEIQNLTHQLQRMDYEDGTFENLQERKSNLMSEIRQLKQQLDRANAYRFELQYKDPEPNFNRQKFHGMVGKLFDVHDNKNHLALMMTASGSLYSYVTDDDVTSKKILQKGQLKKRSTIIPINKITSHAIPQETVDFAQRLVGVENVQSALSLISYDPYFEPVMKFVFGHTLICRSLDVAKEVTFHRNIRCRTVTLEGDIVDPEGTLSGGAPPQGNNILEELARIKRIERDLNVHQQEMHDIDRKLEKIENLARNYNKCKERLELRQFELEACKQRLAQTTFQQHQDEINSLKERINSLETDLTNGRDSQKKADLKIKDIEAKLADTKGHREREKKAATTAMQAAKKKAEQSRNNWQKRQQEFETLKLEIEGLQKSIEKSTKSRDDMQKELIETKENLEVMRQSSAEKTQQVLELKAKIRKQKDVINGQNKEIRNLIIKSDKLQKQNQEMTLEIKKKENEVNKISNDSQETFNKITHLAEKYNWIEEDSQYFGVKNTRYDYTKEDPIAAGQKLNKMQQQKEKMERNINTRAMMLLEREEEQYNETMRRKKIVEQDKQKIENIIVRMDEQKRVKIEKAWQEVNKNFGSIFSTLLQGAQARLNPVSKDKLLFGLEIKVGFNGLWKESLNELSGGQRSLVALSLVLAMLKFSPAPLYILDEVDAALDMSHTQNIGNMLKQHFTNSQFIIVSLKDGMFNNANVLFRTRFEEGVSVVTRTENPRLARRR